MQIQYRPDAYARSGPPRPYGLPTAEVIGIPHADADGITEELIGDVVSEFYRRARRDDRLGPVFEVHIHDWDMHLTRMTDFWSSALLRSGRYSGHPVESHRAIEDLNDGHFARWIALFEETVCELCSPPQAEAFLVRARRMREGLSKALVSDTRGASRTDPA